MGAKKISIKAIIIGAIIDIIGTNLWALGLIMYLVSIQLVVSGPFLAQQLKGVVNFASHPFIFILSLLGGIIFSTFAGYIAASIAKRDELIHGALSSFLCVGFGLYGIFQGSSNSSLIIQLLGFFVSPLLGLVGGYLRLKTKKLSPPDKLT